MELPISYEDLAAQDTLYRYFERNMEKLVTAFQLDVSQKTKIVFQMLNDIEH